jgi:flagellar basal body P-ring formation protein FlgA
MLRFIVFLIVMSCTVEAAEPLQDMQKVRQLGNAWLEQQAAGVWPGVRAHAQSDAVDARLRLAACRELQFSLPGGPRLGNSGSINAQCQTPARWSLYLGYQLRLSGPALVARRDLAARTLLSPADVELREIDYEQAPASYLSDPRLVLGSRCTRRIAAGQPLLADALVRPPTVNAGQQVRIVARGAGFSVDQEGSALNSAAVGEPVRAKLRSGRVLQGVAQDDGSVLVRP